MADYRSMIRSNKIICDHIFEMQIAQEAAGRHRYFDTVIEAVENDGTRGKLIQKLYADIVKHGNTNFGELESSKGNLTKYKHYAKLMDCYDMLSKIQVNGASRSLQLFKELHDMICTCRADFEMGYKFSIDFIKVTYSTLVISLHQLIDVAVLETTDYLRDAVDLQTQKGKYTNRANPAGQYVLTNVERFLTSYKKGEWETLMKSFRKDKNSFLGVGALAAGFVTGAALFAAPIILSALAILWTIRTLVFFYHYGATKLSEYAKSEAAILRKNIEVENDPDLDSKNRKLLDFLEGFAPTVNARLAKAETTAQNELNKSNRAEYNADELRSAGAGDFEFL